MRTVMVLMIFLSASIITYADPAIQYIETISETVSLNTVETGSNPHTWYITFDSVDYRSLTNAIVSEGAKKSILRGWQPVTVPGPITNLDSFDPDNREFWYLKLFSISRESQSSLALRLGKIDDRDIVYLNGQYIGSTGDWESPLIQGADRTRYYQIPANVLMKDRPNVLLVHVKGIMPDQYGISRDTTAIGPSLAVYREYILPDIIELILQTTYLMTGIYALFFFFRRRKRSYENLTFGLFSLIFAGYQFLRTQIPHEIGINDFWGKRLEYVFLFIGVPLLYFFLRFYYTFEGKYIRIWDRIMIILSILLIPAVAMLFLTSNVNTWWAIQSNMVQPTWLIYLGSGLTLLAVKAYQRERDAFYMFFGFGILTVTSILDTLTGRMIINFPPTLSYGFTLFTLSLALTLANRFVRINERYEILSYQLEDEVRKRTCELEESRDQLKIARDSLWSEMQLAKKLQTVLLPQNPAINGFDIIAYQEPAKEVGGDYFDVIHAEGKDWLVIGDVSGHGVTAGLVMMMVQTAIHTVIHRDPDTPPSQLINTINTVLFGNIRSLGEDKYMTITVLSMFHDGTFHFSGLHLDLLLYRKATDSVERIKTDGLWIGIVDKIDTYTVMDKASLQKGDVLLLYTDGITEAMDSHRCIYGTERLARLLAENGKKPPVVIRDRILSSLSDYTTKDDITMMILRRS